MPLKIPKKIDLAIEGHEKWMKLVQEAQILVNTDATLQRNASKGLRIKERAIAPELLGRMYAQYCHLVNRMYEAYLSSVHLQRAQYIKNIVSVFMKRLYELRNELVHLIVNDYIYVDAALTQMLLTPEDIEIVFPCHYAIEAREGSIEELLHKMFADAQTRKNAGSTKSFNFNQPPIQDDGNFDADNEFDMAAIEIESEEVVPDEFKYSVVIQTMERYRQFYMKDFREKCNNRKIYYADKTQTAPKFIREAAAKLIQSVYRKYMQIKRQHAKDIQLDVKLGIIPDPWRPRLDLQHETRKLYLKRREITEKAKRVYLEELEKENNRLIVFKKDNQIDDITEQIREWFREWLYGYGFFPEYPWPGEGGTIMVIRGEFPTIEENKEADEKRAQQMKGKTKDMLKAEKLQAKRDAQLKANAEKAAREKLEQALFKARCNPSNDPGYQPKASVHMDSLNDVLINYSALWSIYDDLPASRFGEVVYGFMKPVMTEDLMCQLHKDCRQIIDELMRLEMKLLIHAHQNMYKLIGQQYPKIKTSKKPNPPPQQKVLNIDEKLLSTFCEIFDLGLVTRPTNKIKDIIGDSNYAAYDLNIRDPDASFPPPGYGDIRRRLKLSCIFGCGIEPGAKRNNAVLLLGEPRNGKSFLVDCVAGELNAVKINISPELLSAVVPKPARTLTQVFVAAKAFQPCVIFLKNIERVFMRKIPPADKYLMAKSIKNVLIKCVKGISAEDKIIFMATCSTPTGFPAGPIVSLFNEVLLVPRADYGSLQAFFYYKLQSIRSMERDYGVQPLAQLLQGFGFGAIIEAYETVMTPKRIIRLNVDPLSPAEFLDVFLEAGEQPLTMEDYMKYVDFYIKCSPLKQEREEYETINKARANAYVKMAKKEAEDAKKKANR